MNFMQAMDIVEEGFRIWRGKEHNAKWWKRIDGTPIPNDLAVNIAEAMCRSSAARIEALEAALQIIAADYPYIKIMLPARAALMQHPGQHADQRQGEQPEPDHKR